MKAVANTNITISKGARILKGQEVTIFRAISPVPSVKLSEVIISEGNSFMTPTSLVNRFFTINN